MFPGDDAQRATLLAVGSDTGAGTCLRHNWPRGMRKDEDNLAIRAVADAPIAS